ncbi:unnamed protein product [Parajaminaea phylloscopi]
MREQSRGRDYQAQNLGFHLYPPVDPTPLSPFHTNAAEWSNRMPPKGRHRKPQGPAPAARGSGEITGKRATQAKNERYARPLPVTLAGNQARSHSNTTWGEWFSSWMPFASSSGKESAHSDDLIGYWDPVTASVWVQVTPTGVTKAGKLDAASRIASQTRTCRSLWECGFFGKGSLSRSEPTWRTRKINEERVKKQREYGMKAYTPEELTAARRSQRMHAKIERARLAVRAGQQLPDGIVALGGTLTADEEQAIAKRAAQEVEDEDQDASKEGEVEEEYGKHIPGLIYLAPKADDNVERVLTAEEQAVLEEEEANICVEDMEWLHLSGFEVLFLAGMLGVLEVRDQQDQAIEFGLLYQLLLVSYHPQAAQASLTGLTDDTIYRPDNPFLLSYIAYHHYRSLGWAVKSGLKFCADWLLYKRGPVFGHAEFAVLVIPVYEDPADEASSPFGRHPAAGDRDWVWFSTMNRVQTQVLKTLVLAHVTIPALSRTPPDALRSAEALVQGLQEGKLHTIREVSLRRWVPARMRG